jgi:hypothetical protein
MKRFFLFCSIAATFLLASSFSSYNIEAQVKTGDVIYDFSEGQIQCLSEIDDAGHLYVFLRSLKENTTVDFYKIIFDKRTPVLVCMMSVKEEMNFCASWTNIQEVKIALSDPTKVSSITLKGKTVYDTRNITVFMPE